MYGVRVVGRAGGGAGLAPCGMAVAGRRERRQGAARRQGARGGRGSRRARAARRPRAWPCSRRRWRSGRANAAGQPGSACVKGRGKGRGTSGRGRWARGAGGGRGARAAAAAWAGRWRSDRPMHVGRRQTLRCGVAVAAMPRVGPRPREGRAGVCKRWRPWWRRGEALRHAAAAGGPDKRPGSAAAVGWPTGRRGRWAHTDGGPTSALRSPATAVVWWARPLA